MIKKPLQKKMRIINGKDDSDSKTFALLGILIPLFGYIIVSLARKDDRYAMHYAKQGLILFIACIIAWAAAGILGWIPIIGELLGVMLYLVLTILWILGIIYSLSGEEKDVPILGHFSNEL